jgi:hypothetical protein
VVGLTRVRRTLPLFALFAVMAGALPAAGSVQPTGFAFGRLGGNIRPYTVTIANSGTVRTMGAVSVGRKHLTSLQLAGLNRVATEQRFVTLPKATNCKGSLPDVAATYVRVAARTVRVHGACLPRYQRLLKALQSSVQIVG